MRVTLIANPVFEGTELDAYIPLGILSLSSHLRLAGHDVSAYEFGCLPQFEQSWTGASFIEAAADYVVNAEPDLVGFSALGSSYSLVLRLAKRIRSRQPGVCIVLGGPHATMTAAETMCGFPQIDFVLRGEAEHSFPQLLDFLETGSPQLDGIAGLVFRKQDGDIHCSEPALVSDMASLRIPAFDLVPRDAMNRLSKKGLPLEVARGCPFKCVFCSAASKAAPRFRAKPVDQLLDEIEQVRDRYDVGHFALVHDTFTVSQRSVEAFCEALSARRCNVTWKCSSRADRLSTSLLLKMRQSGCLGIFCGVESGSAEIQQRIRKRLDVEQTEKVVYDAIHHGFEVYVSLIHGLPEENEEDLGKSLSLVARLKIRGISSVHSHLLTAYPETQLFASVRENLYMGATVSDQAGFRPLDHEDIHMIRQHPDIFSIFYRFPTQLPETALNAISGYVSTVLALFPYTVLAMAGDCPLTHYNLFRSWLKKTTIDTSPDRWDVPKLIEEFVDLAPVLVNRPRDWISAIASYEAAFARIRLAGRSKKWIHPTEATIESYVTRHSSLEWIVTDYDLTSWIRKVTDNEHAYLTLPKSTPTAIVVYSRGEKVCSAVVPPQVIHTLQACPFVDSEPPIEVYEELLQWLRDEGIIRTFSSSAIFT